MIMLNVLNLTALCIIKFNFGDNLKMLSSDSHAASIIKTIAENHILKKVVDHETVNKIVSLWFFSHCFMRCEWWNYFSFSVFPSLRKGSDCLPLHHIEMIKWEWLLAFPFSFLTIARMGPFHNTWSQKFHCSSAPIFFSEFDKGYKAHKWIRLEDGKYKRIFVVGAKNCHDPFAPKNITQCVLRFLVEV